MKPRCNFKVDRQDTGESIPHFILTSKSFRNFVSIGNLLHYQLANFRKGHRSGVDDVIRASPSPACPHPHSECFVCPLASLHKAVV